MYLEFISAVTEDILSRGHISDRFVIFSVIILDELQRLLSMLYVSSQIFTAYVQPGCHFVNSDTCLIMSVKQWLVCVTTSRVIVCVYVLCKAPRSGDKAPY